MIEFGMSGIRSPSPNLKNNVDKISASIDAACKSAERLTQATNRFTLAVVLVALAALGFEIYKFIDARNANAVASDFRMPTANPILEEDRPDLVGEPRIDENE